MQTALHIAALVSQLQDELVGGEIVATQFYRKLRAAYLIVKKERTRQALGLVYHPAGAACFCVPASKVRVETGEKPWPIFGLEGAIIKSVDLPVLDRIFELGLELDGTPGTVVFEALGPNGNLWLLDDTRHRTATLRRREFRPDQIYEPAPITERIDPRTVEPEDLGRQLIDEEDRSPVSRIKQVLLGFNDTLAREVLARAGIDRLGSGDTLTQQSEPLARAAREIAARFHKPSVGYLYEMKRAVEAYPMKLVSVDAQPEKFKTLSLAAMEASDRRHTTVAEADEEKQVTKAVERTLKRRQKLIENLSADMKTAADYELYKRYGDLLQLSRGKLKKGMESITVDDLLTDSDDRVTIKLDPALGPNENIEVYFRRHRKGREGLEILERRLEIAEGEFDELKKIQAELETNFESAHKRYEADILALLPRAGDKTVAAVRLPYRPATLTTGLTIFIGRDGSDNDRTTFDFAKPYELWFHAQQCPGSHVVMKFPHKNFQPSKIEIQETAAITAFHSKARNDSLVPVIYTERRYVRKPRKAKPGLVTVERENSIMVAPKKEDSGRN